MSFHHHIRAMIGGAIAALLLALAAASLAPGAAASAGGKETVSAPAASVPAPPAVGDTRANLGKAFADEMNAKERYTAFAKQADREGYAAVAQLFRACAAAEQVHANRHVHAIAVAGGEARVLLDRVAVGTTAENLATAIQGETWETTEFYPALLERARADLMPDAVRSMTFALAAEREHQRLLTTAFANLEQRPAARPLYVCSYCGRTVETLDSGKCPTCFTDTRKFIRVGDEAPAPAPATAGSAAPPVQPLPPRR